MIDRKTILRLRRQLPIFERYLCMNWAHSGPSPKPVLRAVQRVLEKESRHGPFHPNLWAERDVILGRTRKRLAQIVGAGEDEITLTANTTNGINLAAHLFEWKRGDEVIISNAEHPGGYLPWFALRDRYGIRVRPVSIDGDDERFLDRLKGCSIRGPGWGAPLNGQFEQSPPRPRPADARYPSSEQAIFKLALRKSETFSHCWPARRSPADRCP